MEENNPAPPVSTVDAPIQQAPPKKVFKLSIKAIVSLIIFLLLAGGAAASFTVFRPQIMSFVAKPTPTPLPAEALAKVGSPTISPTAEWKTLTFENFGLQIKVPPSYTVTQEFQNTIQLATDKIGSGGIYINKQPSSKYETLKPCIDNYSIDTNAGTCLDSGKKNGQEFDIQNTKIGEVPAVSVYIATPAVGGVSHFVQTLNEPKIEISARYADTTIFNEIIATVKFLNATNFSCKDIDISPEEPTFLASYCSGSLCSATTQAECDALDVMTFEGNAVYDGQDGVMDCKWTNNACTPIAANAVTPTPVAQTSCIVSGCSNELCTEANGNPVASPCIYKEEYACYKTAECKIQTDGKCGWTKTDTLTTCIGKEN